MTITPGTPETTAPEGPGTAGSKKMTPARDVHLMAVVEQRLAANQAPGGGRPFAGFLAAVRTGLTSSGDPQAHRVTGPFTSRLSEAAAAAARRAAAIRAINKDVASFTPFTTSTGRVVPWRGIGRSLRDLYRSQNDGKYPDGDSADQITAQVGMLPLLDVDSAALVLHTLIGRCADATVSTPTGRVPVTVDFYELARTLVGWGDGISERSTRIRNRIVADFYGALDDQYTDQ